MHEAGHALTVVGGKITTHRLLAEDVLARLQPSTKPWTAGETLPGGDFQPRPGERNRDAPARWLEGLTRRFSDYDPAIVRRFARRFGPVGRAACGERRCHDGLVSVDAGDLK